MAVSGNRPNNSKGFQFLECLQCFAQLVKLFQLNLHRVAQWLNINDACCCCCCCLLSAGETPSAGASRGAARPPHRRVRGPSPLPVAQLRPVEQMELHAVDEHPRQAARRYSDWEGFHDNGDGATINDSLSIMMSSGRVVVFIVVITVIGFTEPNEVHVEPISRLVFVRLHVLHKYIKYNKSYLTSRDM